MLNNIFLNIIIISYCLEVKIIIMVANYFNFIINKITIMAKLKLKLNLSFTYYLIINIIAFDFFLISNIIQFLILFIYFL